MKKLEIVLIGDDTATATISVSDSEAEAFLKVLDLFNKSKTTTGPYCPQLLVTDVDERNSIHERQRSIQEKEHADRINHALGLDVRTPTAIEAAFAKAKKNEVLV